MSLRVAYIISRFPKLSETFVLNEMLALERLGVQIMILPLTRFSESVVHPESQALVERAHYPNWLTTETIGSQFYWLWQRPRLLGAIWARTLLEGIRSPSFLAKSIIVLLQAAVMARRVERAQVDHIHAHFATHPALAAYVVNRITGIPFSFTAHADDIFVERAMLAEKICSATFVVTISDYNRHFLEKLYGTELMRKIEVIHYGIEPAYFSGGSRPDGPEAGPLELACVARLEEKKGHPYLIEACLMLRKAGIRFHCRLVGDGERRDKIEAQIARAGLAAHVELLGAQPRERVLEILGAAQAIVLPSIVVSNGRQEGIPVSLMEAMAMEKPVIATAISGIPELIEHGKSGLLVPPADPRALTEALLEIHADPARARALGVAARMRVIEAFNLDRSVGRLRQLFVESRRHAKANRERLGFEDAEGVS